MLVLLFILNGMFFCSNDGFQTVLYNAEYLAENETDVLAVNSVIPVDDYGRPSRDFHIDRYEYPNHPASAQSNGYLPQVNVTWYEARDICISYGKRLCTIYEYRGVCSGDGAGGEKTDTRDATWQYPYDGSYSADACVTEKSSVSVSGSFSECVTTSAGDNVYDLSGNVWEWVDHDFYGQADQFEGQQAIVGGYYFSGSNAKCSLTLVVPKDLKNEKTGFRCCRDKDIEF